MPYRKTELTVSQAQASIRTASICSGEQSAPQDRRRHKFKRPPKPDIQRLPRGGKDVKPLRVFTWNAGGLGQQLWAEFKEWLSHQPDLDVILVQGTHWTGSSQFKVHGWTAVASGLPEPEQVRSPPAQARTEGG